MKNSQIKLHTAAAAIIIIAAIFVFSLTTKSQSSGSLDTAFGTGGKVLISALPTTTGNAGRKAVLDRRGNIYQFGSATATNGDSVGAVIKLGANGSPDTSFGTNGSVTIVADNTNFSRFHNGVILADGKILAIGAAYLEDRSGNTQARAYSIICRLLPTGQLDPAFGTNGITLYHENFTQINNYFSNIFILPDGKILASGALDYKAGVVRFYADGRLDTTFGTGGRTILPLDWSELWDAALQPDGKLLVAGRIETNILDANYSDLIVARLNPNGALDTTFDSDGIKQFDITPETDYDAEIFWAIELLPDGKILGFARIGSLPLDSAVVKLNTDGTPDTSFGSNGTIKIDYDKRNNLARDMVIQSDGKIILIGADGFPANDFLIQRLNADGSFDTAFGTGGNTTLNFGSQDQPFSATITDDDKLLVAGFGASGPRRFALARFHIKESPSTSGIVRGRAFNLLGRGIKDAAITIQDMANGSVQSAVTDAGGGFSLAVERNKRYKITTSAARCVFQIPETIFDLTEPEIVFNFKANCFRTIK